MVNDKKIEGISDIRDESDRNGMRIVFELKRDSIPNVVLKTNYISILHFKVLSQSTISVWLMVEPRLLNLRENDHGVREIPS